MSGKMLTKLRNACRFVQPGGHHTYTHSYRVSVLSTAWCVARLTLDSLVLRRRHVYALCSSI